MSGKGAFLPNSGPALQAAGTAAEAGLMDTQGVVAPDSRPVRLGDLTLGQLIHMVDARVAYHGRRSQRRRILGG